MKISQLVSNYQALSVWSGVLSIAMVVLLVAVFSVVILHDRIIAAQKVHQTVLVNQQLRELATTHFQELIRYSTITLLVVLCVTLGVVHRSTVLRSQILTRSVETHVINATNWRESSASDSSKALGHYVSGAKKYQIMNSSFIVGPDQVTVTQSHPKRQVPLVAVKFATVNTGSAKTDKAVKKILQQATATDNWQQVVNSTAKIEITK